MRGKRHVLSERPGPEVKQEAVEEDTRWASPSGLSMPIHTCPEGKRKDERKEGAVSNAENLGRVVVGASSGRGDFLYQGKQNKMAVLPVLFTQRQM